MHCKKRLFILYLSSIVLLASSLAISSDVSIDRKVLENVMKETDRQEQNIPEPMKPTKEVEDALKNIQETVNSKQFMDSMKQYQDAIRQQFDVNPTINNARERTSSNDPFEVSPSLSPNERIYVFISSSVPKSTLKNYIRDVDRLNDPNITLVMRGFVGEEGIKFFKPTQRFILGLLLMDDKCKWESGEKCKMYRSMVQIDPMLFSRYEITSVPAMVYADGVNILEPRSSEGLSENAGVGKSLVLYGDTSLEGAIDRFHSETGATSLKTALDVLRKGYYN